jgi:hypothetical protein
MGSFEHGNENFEKFWGITRVAPELLASQEGPVSKELAINCADHKGWYLEAVLGEFPFNAESVFYSRYGTYSETF